MINLSELIREEGNLRLLGSLKFTCSSDVYLAEDVGDFLVNKDRIYIPPYKMLPIFNEKYYCAILHNVCLNQVENTSTGEWWKIRDDVEEILVHWYIRGEYNFEKVKREQGVESGDLVHSVILKQYDRSQFPIIVGVDKSRDSEVVRNSVLDLVRSKLDQINLGNPVPNPS